MHASGNTLRRPAKYAGLMAGWIAVAAVSSAQVTAFNVTQTDNAAGGAALDGFVTNDLSIDFTGGYLGAQLRVVLSSGSIYQDPINGNAPPNAAVVPLFPAVAFDSFVANGAFTEDGSSASQISVFAGAVNLGGDPTLQFDTEGINVAYGPSFQSEIEDRSDFALARLSLSDDAQGTVSVLVSTYRLPLSSAVPLPFDTASFDVVDGVVVPEPAAAVFLPAALLWGRPRRSAAHARRTPPPA